VIIKQLKKIYDGKNGQKGKLDNFFLKKNILDKKANNFLKIGQLCAKNELILGPIPKIKDVNEPSLSELCLFKLDSLNFYLSSSLSSAQGRAPKLCLSLAIILTELSSSQLGISLNT
jgi:hypothetical protein